MVQPANLGEPERPRMDPPTGLRRIKCAPHELIDPLTTVDDVFVIAHLGVPHVDASHWSLTVDGLVGRSRTLRYDDLVARPKIVIEAAHNCCGSPLEPTTPTRRVANVHWGGADLATLLDEIGVNPSARFLWSYGLDGGDFAGHRCDWFVKDLPLARIAAGGVLLAYELNGSPLPAEHGFPVRLVVPGFYGTNSVKWLWRISLADRRAEGMFADALYNDPPGADDVASGLGSRRPVWAIAPDSVIVTPAPDEEVETGKLVEISGWAWSFRGIDRVEVSVDGGASFARATLDPRRGFAWQGFSLPWRPVERGETVICARAADANGMAQPRDGARNAMHAVRVAVR